MSVRKKTPKHQFPLYSQAIKLREVGMGNCDPKMATFTVLMPTVLKGDFLTPTYSNSIFQDTIFSA